ncbi:MAG: SUF system Fe-S cluster assembly regulator [Rudaea sp.]|uniref:SUF system Fe-S cluster assembly regulator n=1 Tax=Rudaea sp. TaxID=2136325 RepID=UPI0039E6C2E2
MLRVSKLTDYATVVMTVLAEAQAADAGVLSAQALAERAHLELPTVSKLLKQLAQAELVESFRGVNGGYRLARAPERISLADILAAMEGPFGMTECSAHAGACGHEPHCGVRGNWRRVSDVIETTLKQMTLADMRRPPPPRRATIPLRLATA